MSRRNPVLKRTGPGRFKIVLDEGTRGVVDDLLGQLDELLEERPDAPELYRLHPPAYLHDPDNDAAFQLLAGEELRTSRQANIAGVRACLEAGEMTEDQAWGWLRSLNALRLVVGTRLDIDDDDHAGPPVGIDETTQMLWDVYGFTTELQHFVIKALAD